MPLFCCRNSSHVVVGAVSTAAGKSCFPLPTLLVDLHHVRAVSPLTQWNLGGFSKTGKGWCSLVMAAMVAALLCRDFGSGSAPLGFCPPRFQQFQAAATLVGKLNDLAYCPSVDVKGHESANLATLFLFGSSRVPGSCDRMLRCSSFWGILESEPVGSFASRPGNGKRDSAKDESLLSMISVHWFSYPQVEWEAVRQLGSCVIAGSFAAAQAVYAAAALNFVLPLFIDGKADFRNAVLVLFVGVFWMALVTFGVFALCFVPGTLVGARVSGTGSAHCVALALCARHYWNLLAERGRVLGLRVGGALRSASLALCSRPWLPLFLALVKFDAWELCGAMKRPHYASQAEATPRVDVGEVSQAPGEKAARSFKDQNPCIKGGSNKRCFFVIDLSGKTWTMTTALNSSTSSLEHDISSITGIPVDRFYLVVNGGRLDPDLSLSQNGIDKDVSVRMCFRLKGGVRQEVPGSWTCNMCNMGGCWPVRQNCFRCGAARGSGPSGPTGRERKYPGRNANTSGGGGNPSVRRQQPQPRPVGPQPSPSPAAFLFQT